VKGEKLNVIGNGYHLSPVTFNLFPDRALLLIYTRSRLFCSYRLPRINVKMQVL